MRKHQEEWGEELRHADERSEHFRRQADDLEARKGQVEENMAYLEKQVMAREEEIKRLTQLYEGGQNLEKLNMKYVQDSNEQAISKLSG